VHSITSHLAASSRKLDSDKSVARVVVEFLSTTHELSSNVVIDKFMHESEYATNISTGSNHMQSHTSETPKARSQLAVATQRAASLFALQEKLLETSINDVQTHLQATKDANKTLGYNTRFFEDEFVWPLTKQLDELQGKHKAVQDQQRTAQDQFKVL
jgi:hypothetical protein